MGKEKGEKSLAAPGSGLTEEEFIEEDFAAGQKPEEESYHQAVTRTRNRREEDLLSCLAQHLKETQQSSGDKVRGEEFEELQVRVLGDNGFLFSSTC